MGHVYVLLYCVRSGKSRSRFSVLFDSALLDRWNRLTMSSKSLPKEESDPVFTRLRSRVENKVFSRPVSDTLTNLVEGLF